MSSEDLLAKAEEVAKKNPFLVLVGAGCLTPNQVPVSATKELGLTNQEEKDAKLIAVFRRDEPEKYQAFLLRVLKEFFKKEKKNMKTEWGETHYQMQGEDLLKKICKTVFKAENDKVFEINGEKVRYFVCEKFVKFGEIIAPDLNDMFKSIWAEPETGEYFCSSNGFSDLTITVHEKEYLKFAQKLGRVYGKKTGKDVRVSREY